MEIYDFHNLHLVDFLLNFSTIQKQNIYEQIQLNKKNVSAYALIESKKNGVFDYLVRKEVLPAQEPLAKRTLASEKSKSPEAPKVPHE